MSTELSPLTSASPDELTALFSADPTTLTDGQLMSLITELRRRRNAFASEEAAKAIKPKKERVAKAAVTTESAAALDKPTAELDLDDLL